MKTILVSLALLALAYVVVASTFKVDRDPVNRYRVDPGDEAAQQGAALIAVPPANAAGRVSAEEVALPGLSSAAFEDEEAGATQFEVRVTLTDWGTGEPIGSGLVSAVQNQLVVATAEIDAGGGMSLWLPAGEFTLVVDGDSLPDGHLPPSRQDVAAPYTELRPNYAPLIEVGGDNTVLYVQVFAFRTARIFGRVTSATIDDLSEVEVTLESVGTEDPSIRKTTHVDRDGFFSVDVIPAKYRVQPRFDQSKHTVIRPRPVDTRVASGREQFVSFAVDPGDCYVTGSLIDPPLVPGEEEIRWRSVVVRLYPRALEPSKSDEEARRYTTHSALATTTTDPNGAYIFEGVDQGEYTLRFSADDFSPKGTIGRFGAWIEPVDLTISGSGTVDVGSHVAIRARPCTFKGTVTSNSVAYDEIVCEVVYPSSSQSSRPAYVRTISIDRNGGFSFFVHTSPDLTPALLRLRRSGSTGWEHEVELEAIPYTKKEVALDFF